MTGPAETVNVFLGPSLKGFLYNIALVDQETTNSNNTNNNNNYILLDVLLCSIAEYFYELCRILTSPVLWSTKTA